MSSIAAASGGDLNCCLPHPEPLAEDGAGASPCKEQPVDASGISHLRNIDRTLRFSAVGLLIIGLSWLMRDILLLGFSAVLVASVLRGASNLVQRNTRLNSTMSLLAVASLLGAAIAGLLWWRGTAIYDQTSQVSDQLRQQFEHLWTRMQSTDWGAILAQQLRTSVRSARAGLTGYFPGVASSVLGVGGSLWLLSRRRPSSQRRQRRMSMGRYGCCLCIGVSEEKTSQIRLA